MLNAIKESFKYNPQKVQVAKCDLSDVNKKVAACSKSGYFQVTKNSKSEYTVKAWNPNIIVRLLSSLLFFIRIPATLRTHHAAAAYLKILDKNSKGIKGNEESTLAALDKFKHRLGSKAFPNLVQKINEKYAEIVKNKAKSPPPAPKVKLTKVEKEYEKNERLALDIILEKGRPCQQELDNMYSIYLARHAEKMKTAVITKDSQIFVTSKTYPNATAFKSSLKSQDLTKRKLAQLKEEYPNLTQVVKSSKDALTLKLVNYKEMELDHNLYLQTLTSTELLKVYNAGEKSIQSDIKNEIQRRVALDPTFARLIIKSELGPEFLGAFDHVTTNFVLEEMIRQNSTLEGSTKPLVQGLDDAQLVRKVSTMDRSMIVSMLAINSGNLDRGLIIEEHINCVSRDYEQCGLSKSELKQELLQLVKAIKNKKATKKDIDSWFQIATSSNSKTDLPLFWVTKAENSFFASTHFCDVHLPHLSRRKMWDIARTMDKPFRFINKWMKHNHKTHDDRIQDWHSHNGTLLNLIDLSKYSTFDQAGYDNACNTTWGRVNMQDYLKVELKDFNELAEMKAAGIFENRLQEYNRLLKLLDLTQQTQKYHGNRQVQDFGTGQWQTQPHWTMEPMDRDLIPSNIILLPPSEVEVPEKYDFEADFSTKRFLHSCEKDLPERRGALTGPKKTKYHSISDTDMLENYLFATDKRSNTNPSMIEDLRTELEIRISRDENFAKDVANNQEMQKADAALVKIAQSAH